jgi:hypothetical protein
MCDEHARGYERERSRKRRKQRPELKTKRWQLLRLQVLSEKFQCAECVREGREFPRPAEEVDHIKPVSKGGAPYARENVQGFAVNTIGPSPQRRPVLRTLLAGREGESADARGKGSPIRLAAENRKSFLPPGN